MQTRSPSNVKGVDVSHHQGEIDWKAVATDPQSICFALIKASEGIGMIDERFRANVEGAQSAGILWGAYHYARPQNPPERDAETFLAAIKGLAPTMSKLKLVLDYEEREYAASGAYNTVWALRWCSIVEQATGIRPALYTGAYYARDGFATGIEERPLWIAHYGMDTPLANDKWDRWTAFQYTDKGNVQGIKGYVDMNVMEEEDFVLVPQDKANKIIEFLKAGWGVVQDHPEAREEFRELANLLRRASGQPEE